MASDTQGERTPPNLAYSYAETIVSGKCPGTTTCTARGTVSAN